MSRRLFTLKSGFLILFFICLIGSISHAGEKNGFNLDIPFNEGTQAESAGDYAKAVESYRKVLFIDGANVKALYRLGEVLLKSDEPAKAYKEFREFLKIAGDSDRLSDEEKKVMMSRAREVVERVKKDRHGFGVLSFLDINVFIITFLLTIAFAIRLFRHFGPRLDPDDEESKKLKTIWVENYWEKQQEKEITGVPFGLFTYLMFVLLVVFYFLTYHILKGFF